MHVIGKAPAKTNLSLLVGPRDRTGYHEVFTVFAPIDLFDELEFFLEARPNAGRRGDLHVKCHAVEGEANLVARALRALERRTGWVLNGQVTIEKGIPMGAGLGGGSTDAAAALQAGVRALADAGGPIPDEATLLALARGLGADVPFFFDPRSAIGRGIGELLEPLALPKLPLVLIIPSEHLSTAHVYRSLDAVRAPENPEEFAARSGEAETRWRVASAAAEIASLLENDLEEISLRLVPELVDRKRALLEGGALGALMSGSGPTVFGIFGSRSEAEHASQRLAARGFQTRLVTAG